MQQQENTFFVTVPPRLLQGAEAFVMTTKRCNQGKKSKNSAIRMSKEMGIEILNEDQYRKLQQMLKI